MAPPGPVTANETDEAVTGSLNVAVMVVAVDTEPAPSAGVRAVTVGGTVSVVVKTRSTQ